MKWMCCTTRLSQLNKLRILQLVDSTANVGFCIWPALLAYVLLPLAYQYHQRQRRSQVPMHFIRVCKWQEELRKLILNTGQSFGFCNYLCKGRGHCRIRIKHFPWISISPLFQQHPRNTHTPSLTTRTQFPEAGMCSWTNFLCWKIQYFKCWKLVLIFNGANHDSDISLPFRASRKNSCPILETREEIIQLCLRHGEKSCGETSAGWKLRLSWVLCCTFPAGSFGNSIWLMALVRHFKHLPNSWYTMI